MKKITKAQATKIIKKSVATGKTVPEKRRILASMTNEFIRCSTCGKTIKVKK